MQTFDPLTQPHTHELYALVASVLEIGELEQQPMGKGVALRWRGRLKQDADAAYAYLAPRFRALGYTALLQQDDNAVVVVAAPGIVMANGSRLWVALLLFALTVASTVFIGGASATGFNLGLGLAFSAALLSILLAHELGHYLVARRLGVAVSYPFFIPMPLPPMGTMGAFIAMKEPPPNRQALLAIAVAGPLAGLVVAIPVLVVGLLLSEVTPLVAVSGQPLILEGNSLLYATVKFLVFGRWLPGGGEDVLLHPVAFAGWAGLLVTGLNLIPAGQLDGGHILFALAGPRVAQIVT
ncbi:MAG: site-2 protease family protein, partial [Chloroflexaceae bacterium]|nr:site-2 protease family protein [Chloroflexaceae bacterium]